MHRKAEQQHKMLAYFFIPLVRLVLSLLLWHSRCSLNHCALSPAKGSTWHCGLLFVGHISLEFEKYIVFLHSVLFL